MGKWCGELFVWGKAMFSVSVSIKLPSRTCSCSVKLQWTKSDALLYILQSKVTDLTVCRARIFLKLGQLLYLLKLPLIFVHYLRRILLFSAMIFPRRRLWPRQAVFIITNNLYGFKQQYANAFFGVPGTTIWLQL